MKSAKRQFGKARASSVRANIVSTLLPLKSQHDIEIVDDDLGIRTLRPRNHPAGRPGEIASSESRMTIQSPRRGRKARIARAAGTAVFLEPDQPYTRIG